MNTPSSSRINSDILPLTRKLALWSVALVSVASGQNGAAASGTWQGVSGTQAWSDSSNWVSGSVAGATTGTTSSDTATFNGAAGGASTVTVDAGRIVQKLSFASTSVSYTIGSAGANGGNALYISNSGQVGILSNIASAVAQTINAPLIFEGTTGSFWSDSSTAAAVLTVNGNVSYAGSGSMTLSLQGRNTGANTIAGVISDGSGGGTLSISKQGQNTSLWVLSGLNTYTGATYVTGGTLRAGSIQAFGNNSAVILGATTVGATAVLALNSNNNTIGSLATADSALSYGSVTLGSATLTISGLNASPVTFAGVISGGGSVVKSGAGVQIFTGANTYTGATTVSAGELDLNNTTGNAIAGNLVVTGGVAKLLAANQIASSKNLTVNSGTFDLQSYSQSVANVQLTSGVIQGSGTLTSSNAYDVQAGTISANLGGSAGLNKTTSGNVALSGYNTYTGATSVTGGTLTLDGLISASSAVSVNTATLAGSGTASGSVTGTNATISGNGLNMGATMLYGSSTLSGYNIASSVTVAGGTTSLSGTTKSTSALSVSAGATLNANGTIDGSATVSGLLKGNTTVTGSLSLTSGTISPGNSPGITTVTGNFSMDSASTLMAEVSGTVAGTSYDQMKVSGNVTLDGTLNLENLSGLTLGETITLIDNAGSGTTTGYFSTIITSGSTYTATSNSSYTFISNTIEYFLSYSSNADGDGYSNDVTLTVVPEPSTWAMLVGGVGALLCFQRASRNRRRFCA